MKPHVSVVVATRGRVELLHRMLESLTSTAERSEDVEVVLRCDSDDDATVDYLRTRQLSFIVGPRPSSYAGLPALVNEAARLSHADLVIVVNDDAVFETQGWDVKLAEVASRYPDGVFDLGVRTELNDGNFVFPCTSRRVVDLIGIHDERLIYSDIWLRDVMRAFDRAVYVPDVVIRHDWHGLSQDQSQAACANSGPAHDALYARCVDEGIEKLRSSFRKLEQYDYSTAGTTNYR